MATNPTPFIASAYVLSLGSIIGIWFWIIHQRRKLRLLQKALKK